MEVRKANQQIIQPEITQKSEVTKAKSSAVNPIADSFEKENAQSASSNSSSTASTEPQKKAGQITGGILIKQMTAARIGETNAKQSSEVSGKKDLSPEQQSSVSNSDPQKKNLNSTSLLQDARTKDEARKNSGLQPPFASNKGDSSEKFTNVSRVGKDQVTNAAGSDQTSNAVKDANRFADGGSIRTQVDAEVAERHQDTNAVGRSTNDQLNDLLNPTAAGPQQTGQTHGKDQLAYSQFMPDRLNPDGTTTRIRETAGSTKDGTFHAIQEETDLKDGTHLSEKTTTEFKDYTKVETHTKTLKDSENNVIESTTTTSTTREDNSVLVKTSKTTRNNDGTYTTTTTEPTGPSGNPIQSYNQENYTGNIPDAVKKTMEYFKQQAAAQKPQSGGETAHTDDNATADPTVGGSVSNRFVEQGAVGLFGNPGSRDAVDGGTTGGQGHLGSQSGGNVDFGQDSDQVGYTGITHEDNPGDVKFGPAEQPKAQTDAKKNEDADSSASNLDPLRKKRRDI
jgi:hypothetical protein